jgi:hypothetical protein
MRLTTIRFSFCCVGFIIICVGAFGIFPLDAYMKEQILSPYTVINVKSEPSTVRNFSTQSDTQYFLTITANDIAPEDEPYARIRFNVSLYVQETQYVIHFKGFNVLSHQEECYYTQPEAKLNTECYINGEIFYEWNWTSTTADVIIVNISDFEGDYFMIHISHTLSYTQLIDRESNYLDIYGAIMFIGVPIIMYLLYKRSTKKDCNNDNQNEPKQTWKTVRSSFGTVREYK